MPKVADPISADEIKALRASLGLTHEAFARRLGVSLPTVQHWASGWRKPGHFASQVLRQMQAAVANEDKGRA
jgi:DNA-binding transcriptional regulator YiaG